MNTIATMRNWLTGTNPCTDLVVYEPKQRAKEITQEVKKQTSEAKAIETSVMTAATAAAGVASKYELGSATFQFIGGLCIYAKIAPTTIWGQFAAAHAANEMAKAALTIPGVALGSNAAFAGMTFLTIAGVAVVGYNSLIAKNPEDKIGFGFGAIKNFVFG